MLCGPGTCRLVAFWGSGAGDNRISVSKPWTSRLALCYGNARSGAAGDGGNSRKVLLRIGNRATPTGRQGTRDSTDSSREGGRAKWLSSFTWA
jgi:hypothetical protein